MFGFNSIATFVTGPKIYTLLNEENNDYEPNMFESSGDSLFTCIGFLKNSFFVLSPIIVPYSVFNHSYATFFSIAKLALTAYFLAYSLRTLGRMTNSDYRKFADILLKVKRMKHSDKDYAKLLDHLGNYDYQVFAAPVDFHFENPQFTFLESYTNKTDLEAIGEPLETIRNWASWLAVHTFGRRLLFPGSLDVINSMVSPTLVDGRRKNIRKYNAKRNILGTKKGNGNKIDTMLIDRRGKSANGDILVICCDGNAGYYETGVCKTPIDLDYSVLGWNLPGFGESTGTPMPNTIIESMGTVMQFAFDKLGFRVEQIVIYAWSLGGFPGSWAAVQYPQIRGLILDASFDDLLPLAVSKMPSIIESVVRYAIRKHLDMPISKLLCDYKGPISIIRRSNDEIIITSEPTASQETRLASNRANQLLIELLRSRHPYLLRDEDDLEYVLEWLSLRPEERLAVYPDDAIEPKILVTDSSSVFDDVEKRHSLIRQLCNKYFVDFESTHNTILNPHFFNIPTPLTKS